MCVYVCLDKWGRSDLQHGGVVPGADEVARVAPHQVGEGGLVPSLHTHPQPRRQVLRTRALEAVRLLAVRPICLCQRRAV